MLRLPYRIVSSVGFLSIVLHAAACGSPPDPGPTEFVKFNYTVTPPGTSTNGSPIVLAVGPVPMSTLNGCLRAQNQILVYASQGPASITITLNGTAVTAPNQDNVQAGTHTVGSTQIDFAVPTGMDEMGNYTNPVYFTTSAASNVFTCYLNLGGPDLFSSFDGGFTCDTLSSDPGRHLTVTDGQFHAVPCPPSGG